MLYELSKRIEGHTICASPNMYDNLSETWIKVSPSNWCPLQINIYLIVHIYVNNVNKMLLSKRPHFNHLDVKKKAPSI
jgi:hypothetical protein